MKMCVFLVFGLIATAFAEENPITDGNSLSDGLRLMEKALSSGPDVTASELREAERAMAYIQGFLGACLVWQTHDKNSPVQLPKSIKATQVIRVIQKWLNDHPEDLHSPANALCFEAIAKAFPNPPNGAK